MSPIEAAPRKPDRGRLRRAAWVTAGCAAFVFWAARIPASATTTHVAALVRMMVHAPDHTSYWGRKSVTLGDQPGAANAVLREFHKPPDKWRFEYISPARVKGRVAIISGRRNTQFEPGRNLVIDTTQFDQAANLDDDNLILRNYNVIEKPDQTVAGRDCIVLMMWPRHSGKPVRKFWVDKYSNTILKREIRMVDGRSYLQSVFEEFHANVPIPDSQFEIPHVKGQKVIRRSAQSNFAKDSDIAREFGRRGFRDSSLPTGYVRESSVISDKTDSVTVRTVYTDGLSQISLFQTHAKGKSKLSPVLAKGSKTITIRGHKGQLRRHEGISSLTWEDSGVRYTLVSEVSPQRLLNIAANVHS